MRLGEDLNVPLRFSLGYALLDGTSDTQRLFKEADERMYANKRERKQQNNTYNKPYAFRHRVFFCPDYSFAISTAIFAAILALL